MGSGVNKIVGTGFDYNSSNPEDGTKCFFMDAQSGDNYVYLNQTVPVTAGKTYNISFYHKEATNGTQFVNSSYIKLSDGSHINIDTQLMPDKVWRKSEKLWTCPQGITSIQIRLGFVCNSYAWMAFDNVQVINTESAVPTKTSDYEYEDNNWKDKLTSYNGKSITYDQIGNPLTYDGNKFSWQAGRQLAGIALNSGKYINFKYNDQGIRTEKNYNGVVTKYYLIGDKVAAEDVGQTDRIRYTYDASGNLISIILNDAEYFYIRNAQSDIIGLIDKSGTQVVGYTYDAWGKLISITGSLKDTVGVKNPYRYKGYRYDTETGLYYLQSRYYNPEWGRFINADGIAGQTGELLSHNIFAYCGNNPVTRFDPNGYDWMDNLISWMLGESGKKPSQSEKMWEAYFAGIQSSINNFAEEISSMVEGLCRSIASEDRISELMESSSSVLIKEATIKIKAPVIFRGNDGWGFKPTKNTQILYSNPNAEGGPGGTFIAYNNKVSKVKWRIDWDPVHGTHGHWGKGKAAFNVHRGIWPWNFGEELDN